MRYGLRTSLILLALAPAGIWLATLALPSLVIFIEEAIANVRWLANR